MKKFTKVCLILAGTFAGIGVILCIVGGAMGASFGKINYENSMGKNPAWVDAISDWFCWDEEDMEASEDYMLEEEQVTSIENSDGAVTYIYAQEEMERIQNLDIDIKAGSLKILESDDEQIHLIVDANGGNVKKGINGDTFIVKDMTKEIWSFFRWQKGVKVVLYLPADMEFKQLSIEVNAGEVNTSAVELTAEEADLSVDAGSLKIGTLKVNRELEVDTGAGEVQIEELTAEKVELDCGVGEMNISGTITGDITADCGVGELNLTVFDDEESFNYIIDCGVGDVKLGATSYTSLGKKKKIDHNAEKTMKLDCGVGSIRVKYE